MADSCMSCAVCSNTDTSYLECPVSLGYFANSRQCVWIFVHHQESKGHISNLSPSPKERSCFINNRYRQESINYNDKKVPSKKQVRKRKWEQKDQWWDYLNPFSWSELSLQQMQNVITLKSTENGLFELPNQHLMNLNEMCL